MQSTRFCIIIFFFIIVSITFCFGQKDSLYVSGDKLYNECNEQLILNGVNYSVLDDWEFPSNLFKGGEKLSEIAKTGANAVRIQWYNNYGQKGRAAYTTADLDSLLTRCKRLQLIPVVGLWDLTCGTNWTSFDTLITNWWTRPENVALINKHKAYLIVNICNEFAQYEWSSDTTKALQDYKTNYNAVVAKLRKAGIHVPLMIDAPDCGQNVECIAKCGNQIINTDPLKNVLFGVHAYWYYYTQNNSVQTVAKINEITTAKIPVVFSEVADYQSINTSTPCQYYLDYPTILNTLKKNKLGWMGWTWYEDDCTYREMADSGYFSKLGIYGNDLVNNAVYGIKTNATKKSCSFNINNPLPIQTCSLRQSNIVTGSCLLVLDYYLTENTTCILQKSTDGILWQDQEKLHLNSNADIHSLTINIAVATSETFFRVKYMSIADGALYSNVLIEKNEASNQLQIFPNPAERFINVESISQNSEILVYSAFGSLIIKKRVDISGTIKVDVSSLPNGYYYIKTVSKNGLCKVAAFIKC